MLTHAAGPSGHLKIGQLVRGDVAEAMVAGGFAEWLDTQETAAIQPAETATKPKKRTRTRKKKADS